MILFDYFNINELYEHAVQKEWLSNSKDWLIVRLFFKLNLVNLI